MAAAACPSVEYDGKTWVMVEHETDRRHQTGNTVVLSRSEVEGVITVMDRKKRTMESKDWEKQYAEKHAAYSSLVDAGASKKK